HRYHQAKASGQSQGAQSKSSSAHSSRSTSPGPHWRNEGISTYKPTDRRSLEPLPAPSASSSSSTRPGRSQNSSVRMEVDAAGARSLLPKPPRDRSEPRHFNPLRNKEMLTRRLSGDSDSSTASSKGGGGRQSLGGPTRRSGEQVVLLVNRKEGKHMIERAGTSNQTPSTHSSKPRARSQSRERSSLPPTLKPNPPMGSSVGTRTSRTDRERSVGHEGPRRLHVPRSHSQSKMTSSTLSSDGSPAHLSCPRTSQPLPSGRQEDLAKQVAPSSPRGGVGFGKKQSFSCTNSPVKGVQGNNNSPIKKTVTTPRPQAPRSPSTGKGKPLPPVTSGGRRPPHSSPRNSNNYATRSLRLSQAPRSAGRGQPKNVSHLENQDAGEEGLGLAYQMLPPLDPQKEQDLYRSFEAEFLANTQQVRENFAGRKTPLGLSSVTGDVPLENHQLNLPYDLEDGDSSDNLPPPAGCQSPVPLAPSEDCSFQDSSSENSSMSFSLSESRSGSSPPSLKITNGENGQSDEVPISEHKLGVKLRPRSDNRLQNTPSRIPTPVRHKNVHTNTPLSPCNTPPLSRKSSHPASCKNLHQNLTDMIHPQSHSSAIGSNDCSYPAQGSLDTEAIAQN
ncbi:hypothetical protein GOODEAATRI_020527, partial [Goodea atripinnis]